VLKCLPMSWNRYCHCSFLLLLLQMLSFKICAKIVTESCRIMFESSIKRGEVLARHKKKLCPKTSMTSNILERQIYSYLYVHVPCSKRCCSYRPCHYQPTALPLKTIRFGRWCVTHRCSLLCMDFVHRVTDI
jgi:hypothetical protein